MKDLLRISFLIMIGLALITGCSKDDDDNNDTPPEVILPEIQNKLDEINVPENLANSQTWYAVQVSVYISQVKNITNYFGYFNPIEGAEYNDGVYFWSYGGQSVWLDYSETSDAYVYNMDVDFGNGRVKYISSQQQKDGTTGWMRIYDFTSSDNNEFTYEYAWEIMTDGSVILNQSNAESGFELEIKGSPDDSGYAFYYDDSVPEYEFVWNSDGSGYYTTYDDSGVEIETTNWTVEDL